MSVSHAPDTAMTSSDEMGEGSVPGLLKVLARVPRLEKEPQPRYVLTFVLPVAAASWRG